MHKQPYKTSGDSGKTPLPDGFGDLDDFLNEAVSAASGIGAGILAGLSGVLEQVGDAVDAARGREEELPFAKWKRRLEQRLKNGPQGDALGMAISGWALAACFGIAALVMFCLSAVGPEVLGVTGEEFLVFPILMACFTPITVGFGIMGGLGIRKYRYFNRLRRYLRVARDWVCEVRSLARDSGMDPRQVSADLVRAVAGGYLPDALLQDDGKLYLDITRCAPQEEAAPEQPVQPTDDLSGFQQEGQRFLAYLDSSVGQLGEAADSEIAQMRRTCAAILGFVHNHPQQLTRVRRFREYYLPTTRKLLDTAQGLGDSQVQHAQEIRRDITGILHTLNTAYSKLYDTLLQDVSLDVSTEIDTLETMLRQDGLTHDFEMDFTNG